MLRWVFAAGMIGSAVLGSTACADFDAAERRALHDATQRGGFQRAREIVLAHARNADEAEGEFLIAEHHFQLLAAWVDLAARDHAPVIESLAVHHFDDPAAAPILLNRLWRYETPALFEAMYRDVEDIARRMSERRAKCRYVQTPLADAGKYVGLPSLMAFGPDRSIRIGASIPPVYWHLQCADANLVSASVTKSDGHDARRSSSLSTIGHVTFPGAERRLAPLLRDLTLLPSVEPAPNGWLPQYDETVPPANLLVYLVNRETPPRFADLADILDAREKWLPVRGADYGHWLTTCGLLRLTAMNGTPGASRLVVRWIEKVPQIGDEEIRERVLQELIPVLGPFPPEAQVDLASVRARVLPSIPDVRRPNFTHLFDRAEQENRALRDPNARGLVIALRSPERARLVPALLSRGAPVDGDFRPGERTPLLEAIVSAPAMVPLLLDRGADVNRAGGPNAQTPLIYASGFGDAQHAEIVALLVDRGARIDARDQAGSTALHSAAEHNAGSARTLLKGGAAVDARDRRGQTPLFEASTVEAAALLLDAGADPNAIAADGESPYSNALRNRSKQIQELLAARGGKLTLAQLAKRARDAALAPIVVPLIEHGQRH